MKAACLLFAFFSFLNFHAPVLGQEVIVYESWSIHMESSGGWVAAEKGFYGKVAVREVPGGPGISPIQRVFEAAKSGRIAFGVDYPDNILRAREEERVNLVAVSVDFQTSAMRIISWRPIKSSREIRGDFGIWTGYEGKAKCAVGKGWEKQFTIEPQGEDIKPWLEEKWQLASAMTYHELITAQREVKRMKRKFYTIDYRDLGIDWMDNVLFTTEETIKKYPEVVQAVITGRYKGFRWAFENPRETFEVLKKVNEGLDLAHEMDALSPIKALMITADTRKSGLGYIQPKKWGNVAKDMMRAGLLERLADVKRIYTDKFPSNVMPK